jgi:alanine racemase
MIESPNRINIDLSALEHNLNQVKKLVGQKTRIMGVVKSDAYGHGLLPVSRVLERNGVDYLGAAHVYEALELRRGGIKLPIAVLLGIRTREEATAVVETDLTPVLFDVAAFEVLAGETAKKGKNTPVLVKVDTGMGRLGIPHWEIGAFLERVMKFEALHVEGLFSHLSSADSLDNGFTGTQIEDFKKAIEIGRALGLELPMNSLANSAGVMAHKDTHFNLVRPGIMLYGGLPSPRFPRLVPLKPVMRFSGQIIQVRDFPDHTPIGYGRTYHTRGSQKAAVLSAGYGDGLFRSLSNRGKVLIRGKKVDLIGRISMNMAVCEVSGLKDVTPGMEAVFLGAQGEETITGDDMADWAETISYEVFCSIGIGRNREYRG